MDLRRKAPALVAMVLAIALAIVPGVTGQAVRNPDTLVVVKFGDPESLDPAYQYDTASSEITLWNVYETLIFFNGQQTGSFVPMLATNVPTRQNGGISSDGRTYTFTIRQGVRFHDGSPMTAEDVKYSLMRFMFMDRDSGPSWLLLAPILGVEGTRDDNGNLNMALFDQADRQIQIRGNSVSITLKEPFAPFLGVLASFSTVTSRRWNAQNGGWDGTRGTLARLNNPSRPEDTTLFSRGMGTGPFRIVNWDRSARVVTLERNQNYWREPARLQRIIFRTVEEFGPRRLMLQQGDADYVAVNRTEQAQVTGLAGVRIVDDLSQLANTGIFMNQNVDTSGGNPDVGSGRLDGNGVPPDFFRDVNVRRGVAYSFDYATAVRDCYRGKATVGRGPIPRGMFGYNPNQRWYPTDRERAAAAFREARGGEVWSRGFRFTVTFNTGNTSRQCLAQVMKAGLEALNPRFRVDVRGITWAQYLTAYRQRKLPMWIIGWSQDFPDPDNFVSPYLHSAGTYAQAESYKNDEVDRLVEQGRRETDRAARQRIYYRLQEIAFNDVPTLWIDPVTFVVMRDWVRGWYWNPAFSNNYLYLYGIRKGR